MILPVHAHVRSSLQAALTRAFGLAKDEQPVIVIETPPKRSLGDLAVPVAFELARTLRQAPRAIAQALSAALGPIDGVARVVAAPNGYVNFYLDRAAFLRDRLEHDSRPAPVDTGKVIVVAVVHPHLVAGGAG